MCSCKLTAQRSLLCFVVVILQLIWIIALASHINVDLAVILSFVAAMLAAISYILVFLGAPEIKCSFGFAVNRKMVRDCYLDPFDQTIFLARKKFAFHAQGPLKIDSHSKQSRALGKKWVKVRIQSWS